MIEHRAWERRHVEALRAWEHGDVDDLIRLCEREVVAEAVKCTNACHGAISFDEFAQAGREAVWNHRDRYDPKRGKPFQAFIRRRIRGAMKELWGGIIASSQEEAPERPSPAEALKELVALVESGERHESVIIEAIETALGGISLEDWRYVVRRDAGVSRYFASLLGQAEYKQLPRKYQKMLGIAVEEHWIHVFGAAVEAGASFTNISGPQHMVSIQRRHKARNPYAPPIPRRKLTHLLGVSDKTIKEWEERIREAGPPPLRDDGSFTLKTQHDYDEWVDYWTRIADPVSWRRLHKRRTQEAE